MSKKQSQTGYAGRCKIYDDQLELLSSAISGPNFVLEIGTLDGVTASLLALWHPHATIVSVDIFEQVTPEKWLENRRLNMRLFVGTVSQFAMLCPGHRFDVVFVDGDHRYEGCLQDLRCSSLLATEDGRIFVHDYDDPARPGVTKAVNAFVKGKDAGWRLGRRAGTLQELVRIGKG